MHLFHDRIYVSPSRDYDAALRYNMNERQVYASNDLIHWQDHGAIQFTKSISGAKLGSGLWSDNGEMSKRVNSKGPIHTRKP